MNYLKNELPQVKKNLVTSCEKIAEVYLKESECVREAINKVNNDFSLLDSELSSGKASNFIRKGIILSLKKKAYERPLK